MRVKETNSDAVDGRCARVPCLVVLVVFNCCQTSAVRCPCGAPRYMCPELLRVVRDLKSGKGLAGSVEIADSVLEANDAFGVGCVVGFLCSRGIHPFDSGRGRDVADNILANKRNKACLRQIKEARHLELLKRLTAHERQQQWTMALAEQHSRIFDAAMSLSGTTTASGHFDAGVLLDMIQFRERPRGSCRDQLLQPGLVDHFPELPALVEELERLLRDGRRSTSLRLARPLLDEDSYVRQTGCRGTSLSRTLILA